MDGGEDGAAGQHEIDPLGADAWVAGEPVAAQSAGFGQSFLIADDLHEGAVAHLARVPLALA